MNPTSTIHGIAASPGRYRGRARVIPNLTDADRISPGDVLVTHFTRPDVVRVFGVAGAIVTDHGGSLSHAAVVAREVGIPAVVGTSVATVRISDGAMVLVDGTAGTVEELDEPTARA